jgi:hypothetical protein
MSQLVEWIGCSAGYTEPSFHLREGGIIGDKENTEKFLFLRTLRLLLAM